MTPYMTFPSFNFRIFHHSFVFVSPISLFAVVKTCTIIFHHGLDAPISQTLFSVRLLVEKNMRQVFILGQTRSCESPPCRTVRSSGAVVAQGETTAQLQQLQNRQFCLPIENPT